MRGFRSTFILLLVLLGLVGYIYFYEMKRPAPGEAAEQKQKVFSVETGKIEEVDVKAASGERTVLRKSGDAWRIAEPIAVKADDGEVTGIVTNLASLEIQRVVDENANDLAQFGLAAPRIEVGFRTAGQAGTSRLLLGDTNATGGEIYAKLPASARVFLVSSFLEATFNKRTFDLRDKTVLAFDRAAVDALEIVTKDLRLAFAKTGEVWALTSPIAARADQGQVQGAIGSLQTLAMKSIAAPEAADKDLAKYGLDKPELTATVGAGSARATLAIGKTDESGNVFARDVASPMVVTIDPSLIERPAQHARQFPAEGRLRVPLVHRQPPRGDARRLDRRLRADHGQGRHDEVAEAQSGEGLSRRPRWTRCSARSRACPWTATSTPGRRRAPTRPPPS